MLPRAGELLTLPSRYVPGHGDHVTYDEKQERESYWGES